MDTSPVKLYLQEALSCFTLSHSCQNSTVPEPNAYEVPDQVFSVLSSRPFTYLGRKRSEPYRARTRSLLYQNVAKGQPLRFYFDIGGGYHASINPGVSGLTFEPGLGELLILRQIRLFQAAIQPIYPPGVHFSLVVDNLCALLVNDIPTSATSDYVKRLRQLISSMKMNAIVDVLVESEHFDPDFYDSNASPDPTLTPTDADLENVQRFLGRNCDRAEAVVRMALYKSVTVSSETHLKRLIDGVHMTQRATEHTFGFRPFPGGDSRIQAGEVALMPRKDGKLCARLLTSRSAGNGWSKIYLPDLLPSPLQSVIYCPMP